MKNTKPIIKKEKTKSLKKNETTEIINHSYKKWTDLFPNTYSIHMSEVEAAALAKDIIDSVQRDDELLKIDHYLNRRQLLRSSFYEWKEKFPVIAKALEYFNQIVAERREKGALTGKYPVNAIMPYLHIFDADYRQAIEFRASLAKQEDKQTGNIINVYAESIESSPLVPVKKSDEA